MSLSESEGWIPSINEGLSIPELINLIRYSFRQCEFNEVQNVLMDREKKMKIEIENLMRDRDSVKEEARLMERTQSLAELEKLKLEEKLQTSQRKCEELKETITKLTEEQSVSFDRAKMAEERYAKLSEENSSMVNEKDKLISRLNEKLNELKNINLEGERLVGVYQEKLKSADASLVKIGQEIEDLRHENLVVNQTVEELRQKQFESQVVEELKRQILEATQTVDELRLKKMKSDKTAELYKSSLQKLEPRIVKVEATLANLLKVKVEDLANLVGITDKGGNVDLPNIFMGWEDSVGNGRANADAEDVVVKWPREHSASNSTESEGIRLPKKDNLKGKKGERNLVQSRTKEDDANTVRTSPGSQSGHSPHVESDATAQDNEGEDPQVSGCRNLVHSRIKEDGGDAVRTSPGSQSGHSPHVENDATTQDNESEEPHISGSDSDGGVPIRGKSMFGDVIELCDSDDETNPDDKPHISDQANKRNMTDSTDDSPVTKRKRSIFICDEENKLPMDEKENQLLESSHDRHEERSGLVCDSLTPPLNVLNDVDSTDSEDESYSDAHMDNLVATVRSICSRT